MKEKKKIKKHYTKKENGKNMTGRPAYDKSEIIRKLEDAFVKGHTVRRACAKVGISQDYYYRLIKYDDKLREHFEMLKEDTSIRAVENISEGISNGDIELSKWWSERKLKDEFSTKISTDVSVTDAEKDIEDRKQSIKEFLADTLSLK